MFWSFSVGALCALLAAFLIAAVIEWAEFQPNRVVAARGADSGPVTVSSISVDSASVRSAISGRLMHEGSALYGGVLKFSNDASDLLRTSAQRSSI